MLSGEGLRLEDKLELLLPQSEVFLSHPDRDSILTRRHAAVHRRIQRIKRFSSTLFHKLLGVKIILTRRREEEVLSGARENRAEIPL